MRSSTSALASSALPTASPSSSLPLPPVTSITSSIVEIVSNRSFTGAISSGTAGCINSSTSIPTFSLFLLIVATWTLCCSVTCVVLLSTLPFLQEPPFSNSTTPNGPASSTSLSSSSSVGIAINPAPLEAVTSSASSSASPKFLQSFATRQKRRSSLVTSQAATAGAGINAASAAFDGSLFWTTVPELFLSSTAADRRSESLFITSPPLKSVPPISLSLDAYMPILSDIESRRAGILDQLHRNINQSLINANFSSIDQYHRLNGNASVGTLPISFPFHLISPLQVQNPLNFSALQTKMRSFSTETLNASNVSSAIRSCAPYSTQSSDGSAGTVNDLFKLDASPNSGCPPSSVASPSGSSSSLSDSDDNGSSSSDGPSAIDIEMALLNIVSADLDIAYGSLEGTGYELVAAAFAVQVAIEAAALTALAPPNHEHKRTNRRKCYSIDSSTESLISSDSAPTLSSSSSNEVTAEAPIEILSQRQPQIPSSQQSAPQQLPLSQQAQARLLLPPPPFSPANWLPPIPKLGETTADGELRNVDSPTTLSTSAQQELGSHYSNSTYEPPLHDSSTAQASSTNSLSENVPSTSSESTMRQTCTDSPWDDTDTGVDIGALLNDLAILIPAALQVAANELLALGYYTYAVKGKVEVAIAELAYQKLFIPSPTSSSAAIEGAARVGGPVHPQQTNSTT